MTPAHADHAHDTVAAAERTLDDSAGHLASRNDGVSAPALSAMALTMKLGPLPM